jgi:probable biosynthetic protein (TIGR04098 family)
LRTTHLAAALARRWTPAEGPEPAIAGAARAARRGARVDDPFCGPILGAEGPALGQLTYEPSPWADYNGAGLLYFASYVTIADTAAHRILRRRETGTNADWALATSPVQRDVYYYENLPLGAALTATLHLCEATDSGLVTRVRLGREDGRPMADVITRRAFTFMAGAGREAP